MRAYTLLPRTEILKARGCSRTANQRIASPRRTTSRRGAAPAKLLVLLVGGAVTVSFIGQASDNWRVGTSRQPCHPSGAGAVSLQGYQMREPNAVWPLGSRD